MSDAEAPPADETSPVDAPPADEKPPEESSSDAPPADGEPPAEGEQPPTDAPHEEEAPVEGGAPAEGEDQLKESTTEGGEGGENVEGGEGGESGEGDEGTDGVEGVEGVEGAESAEGAEVPPEGEAGESAEEGVPENEEVGVEGEEVGVEGEVLPEGEGVLEEDAEGEVEGEGVGGEAEKELGSITSVKKEIGPEVKEDNQISQRIATGSQEISRTRSQRIGSKARSVLGSVISLGKRLSFTAEGGDKTKGIRYMNTYKLFADNPFNPEKVENILREVLTEAIEGTVYDPVANLQMAKVAAFNIRNRIKELEFDRYVVLVSIGEKNNQDLMLHTRFLWDPERDRYAFFTIENAHIYGIAQCFGIYFE